MMTGIAVNQILLLLFQCLIVGSLLLFLFRLRTIFGLSLLFTALGVFQYMQVFLAASLYIEVLPGISVSPGSMVMFTGSLFAILLVYIREDALEARKVIYALLAANLVLALLQLIFSWAIEGEYVNNIYNLPKEFFTVNSRFLFVGTIVLFIDAFIIIFIYEAIARNIPFIFLRILITMTLVLAIDTILFSLGVFAGTDKFGSILVSGLVSKFLSAIVYATLFSIYILYIDKGLEKKEISTSFEDIFHTLTYRQKFEHVSKEKETQRIELQKSEEYNRLLFNTSPIGLALTTLDGSLVDVNPTYTEILGRTIEETLKLSYWDITPEKYASQEAVQLESLEETGSYGPYEKEYIHSDGHLVPVLLNGLIIERNDEKFIWSSVEDITERKQAEEAIKNQAAKWQTTFDAMSDSVSIIDLDGKITQCNAATLSLFNIKEEDLKEKFCYQLVHGTSEHFTDCPLERTKISKQFESMVYQDKNRWLEVSVDPIFDSNNELIGVVHMVSDITERKQAEEALRQYEHIVSSSSDMLALIDKHYTYLSTNNAYLEAFNFSSEQLIGNKVVDVFGEEIFNVVIKPYAERCLRGEEVNYQEWFDFPNLGKCFMDITYYPYYNEDSVQIGFVVNGRNITENKLAKEKIERFSRIFEDSLNEIYLFDEGTLKFTHVNNAAQQNLGYTMEELRKITVLDLKPEFTGELFAKLVAPLRKDEKEKILFETVHKRKDQSLYNVEVHLQLLKFEQETLFAGIILDITERKLAEESVRESEARLNEAQRLAKIGSWELNLITNTLHWSDEVYRLFDLEPKQFGATYEAFLDNIHPDDREFVNHAYSESVKNKKPYDIVHRLLLKDGTIKFVTEFCETYYDDAGKATHSIGTIQDITERKQAEETLQKSEAKLNEAQRLANIGDFTWNIETGDVSWSDGMYELLKYDKNDNINLTKVNTDIHHPDDFVGVMKWFEESFASGMEKLTPKEYRLIRNDGKVIEVHTEGNISYKDGKAATVFGMCQDITDRKLAVEELKKYSHRLQILHEMDKAILAAESQDKISLTVLKDMASFISFKIATVAEYDEFSDTFTRTVIFPSMYNEYVDNTPIPTTEYGLLNLDLLKNGQVQIIEDLREKPTKFENAQKLIDNGLFSTVLIPLISEDKLLGILNFVGESMDVFPPEKIEVATEVANQLAISFQQWKLREEIISYTEELEQKVKQRTEQLEHSNQELREFAQIVSHDLKAPLRAISQLSYWVWKDYSDKIDEEGQEKLKMMIGRVKRLDNLIEGILQYSRAGRQREKEIPINLQLLVEDSITLLDPPSNIKIIIENQLPEYLGDPTRLGQLFQNLINNAIKFMDKPNGIIKIGCTKDSQNWQFYVSDNGPGIEKKYFDRIFQVFQRLVSRDDQEGTGIGLSLAKRIVQIHGGTIWLTSIPGEGTTFYFTLRLNT